MKNDEFDANFNSSITLPVWFMAERLCLGRIEATTYHISSKGATLQVECSGDTILQLPLP